MIGGVVQAVDPEGIAHEVGIEPGDRLLSINGHMLRDVIDYQYYGAEESLVLQVAREQDIYSIEIERDYDESLGIRFEEALFDGMRRCANACPFCFVEQMPRGMRSSLYVRDDDYRYSFLHGSYITLTNLSEADWERIGEQHLSPLYVSIHATDTDIRRELLGNPTAPDIMDQLDRLAQLNIMVHGQIVLVPGINDSEVLDGSIENLLSLWPTVQTLALVPVGLTRFCPRPLRELSQSDANAVLEKAIAWQGRVREHTGTTWLYPSDELYLLAGEPVPPATFYQDDAQRENGVGLVRELVDDWAILKTELSDTSLGGRQATLVCGTLIAPILVQLVAELSRVCDIELTVVPVENTFFGSTVTVSGLLTGHDLLTALQGRILGEAVFIPRAMLDDAGERTLDDMTLDDLGEALVVPVFPAENLSEIVDLLLDERSNQ